MNDDREKTYMLKISPFQRRLMINGLNEYLTLLAERGQPVEDICDLLTEVINIQEQSGTTRRGLFAGIRRREEAADPGSPYKSAGDGSRPDGSSGGASGHPRDAESLL